jgi:hypothetical protein
MIVKGKLESKNVKDVVFFVLFVQNFNIKRKDFDLTSHTHSPSDCDEKQNSQTHSLLVEMKINKKEKVMKYKFTNDFL